MFSTAESLKGSRAPPRMAMRIFNSLLIGAGGGLGWPWHTNCLGRFLHLRTTRLSSSVEGQGLEL